MIVEIFSAEQALVIGRLALQGVRFQQPDGSLYVPRANGQQVPFSFACEPPQLLAENEILPIVSSVGLGGTNGHLASGRHWRLQHS
jgi:hypothetical protein